ncbi:MAG TPA: CPBP family intramembrane glutamic endopeptidase [Rhizomicrobium sp.]|nr:CPBP family intramembrane glutamic endopeptidase [Rhizomicrobium sp.]
MTSSEIECPAADAAAPQPIKGWIVLVAPILGTVIFAVLGIIAVIVYAVKTGDMNANAFRDLLSQSPYAYYIGTGVSGLFYVCLLFSAWLLLPKRGPASLASYFAPVSFGALATGALSAVAMALFVGPALYAATNYFHLDLKPTTSEMMLVPKNVAELITVLVFGALIAPLVEEVYFRGLFLRWLRKWMWVVFAIAINSLAFAGLHFRFISHAGLGGIVVTAALMIPGVVLAILAVRTKSLWPGVLAHGVYNGLLLALSFISPDAG